MKRKPWSGAIDPARYRDALLDSINEGVFTVDRDWRITSFNRAAERITGIVREQAIGQRCCEVFRANVCERDCLVRRALSGQPPPPPATVYIVDAHGERIPVKASAAILRDGAGQVLGGVETFQDLRHREDLHRHGQRRLAFPDIVGQSPAITRLLDLLPTVAESSATVLLQGPSGSGKELFARALHGLSPRKNEPFVAVSCAALPDTLLEAELFGYEAGAFTDAKNAKPGRFAVAGKGTLFLDEVAEMSPALQVRLLRVLQEKTFEPLGAVRPVRTQARIVAASHRDLHALVEQGAFRQDLYYRIHVVRLDIPPLSERRQDIPLLVDHFVHKLNAAHDRDIAGLSDRALALLMKHPFPGNVRELHNAIEHAFVLCRGDLIEPHHLPPDVTASAAEPASAPSLPIRTAERALIERALAQHEGNRGRAARDLGIDPSTLYRKIKRLGIEVPDRDGRTRKPAPAQRGERGRSSYKP